VVPGNHVLDGGPDPYKLLGEIGRHNVINGENVESAMQKNILSTWPFQITLQFLVCSLVSCCVYEWVFSYYPASNASLCYDYIAGIQL